MVPVAQVPCSLLLMWPRSLSLSLDPKLVPTNSTNSQILRGVVRVGGSDQSLGDSAEHHQFLGKPHFALGLDTAFPGYATLACTLGFLLSHTSKSKSKKHF